MPAATPISRPLAITSTVLQVAVAGLFVMTAITKLTAQEEAKWIFEQVGLGDAGMYATGVAELVAAVMLFVPKTRIYGAILALLVIVGAIGSHMTKLGISVKMPDGTKDGGTMFGMAVVVFLASAAVLVIRRAQLPVIGARFATGGESKAA